MTLKARLVLGVGSLFVLAPIVLANPDRTDPAKSDTSVERIKKTLDQPFNVEFQGHTLPAAIDTLRDQTKLNIILDRASLLQMGLEPETLVLNLKLNNVKLKTILKNALSQFGLTFVIDSDVVLLTTEHQAHERQIRQRVSVDLDKMPLDQALKQLSRETGVNLVIDPRHAGKIKETVTLKLDEVPLEIAVRLISEIAGLRSVRQANVIFVTSKEVAAELRKEEGVSPESPVQPLIESIRFMGGGNVVPPVAAPVVQPAVPAPPADKPVPRDK